MARTTKPVVPHYLRVTSAQDAEHSEYVQAETHHRMFYKLFKDGIPVDEVNGMVPRLLGMIDRRIPIHYPTTARDHTSASMQKFFLNEWKPGTEDAMSTLLKAYIKAGYISLTAAEFELSTTSDKQGMLAGTVLQHAIVRCAPVVVRTLCEAGSDPRLVPHKDVSIRSGTQHAMGAMLEIKKGDGIGFAEAYHEPGAEVPLLVRSALMHLAIDESSLKPGEVQLAPVPISAEAINAAAEGVLPSTTAAHRRLGL